MSEAPPQSPPKKSVFSEFKGMSWWQIVLSVLPLALIGVGGALGGLCGAAALVANIKIAKSGLPGVVKALVMIAVDIAAAAVWFVMASAILNTLE